MYDIKLILTPGKDILQSPHLAPARAFVIYCDLKIPPVDNCNI